MGDGMRSMAGTLATAALCLALACGVSGAAGAGATFPAFVWGSGAYVAGSGERQTLQASYEVLPASLLAEQLFGASACSADAQATGPALDCDALRADAQRLVSVFVDGSLVLSDLATDAPSTRASALQCAVKAAPAALYLASVESQGLELREAVAQRSSQLRRYGECGAGSLPVEQLSAQLQQAEGPAAVLLCEAPGSQQLASLVQQLQASGRPFLVTYAGKPEQLAKRPVARTLITTSAVQQNQTVLCSAKCRTQVRLFEALILIVLLLTALAVGLCMLHILDTPSRFEAEKKEASRHQD